MAPPFLDKLPLTALHEPTRLERLRWRQNCGLATVRYPVLEISATVEGYANGRGFSLRVLRAGRARDRIARPEGKRV